MAASLPSSPACSLPLMLPFNGATDHLSNLYPCVFTVDGVAYRSVEHFFQASKAAMFGDELTRQAIISAPKGGVAKRLGRRVRPFDASRWKEACESVMRRGLEAKFTQDQALASLLLQTDGCLLIESVKSNKYWGSGLSKMDIVMDSDPAQAMDSVLVRGPLAHRRRLRAGSKLLDPSAIRGVTLPGLNRTGELLMETRDKLLRGERFEEPGLGSSAVGRSRKRARQEDEI